MLVLSRGIGQAVVIDRRIEVTVLVIAPKYIEVSVAELGGAVIETLTLDEECRTPVTEDVRISFIRAGNAKCRIGLEYPKHVLIERKEFMDDQI